MYTNHSLVWFVFLLEERVGTPWVTVLDRGFRDGSYCRFFDGEDGGWEEYILGVSTR